MKLLRVSFVVSALFLSACATGTVTSPRATRPIFPEPIIIDALLTTPSGIDGNKETIEALEKHINSRFLSCLNENFKAHTVDACIPGSARLEAKVVKFQTKVEKPSGLVKRWTKGFGGSGGDIKYSIGIKSKITDCVTGKMLGEYEASENNEEDIEGAIEEIVEEVAEKSVKIASSAVE